MLQPSNTQRVLLQAPTEKRMQLGALTGLRFIAALGVVLHHYLLTFILWNPATSLPLAVAAPTTAWTRLEEGGALGVDCFFVLSGFILAYTYVTPTGGLKTSRGTFWVARVARIYPVYLVGLALALIPLLRSPHHLGGLLLNIGVQPLLLQAWLPSLNTWDSWNPPGWSLSVEAFFYLLFPFILIGLARLSRRALWAVAGLSCGVFAVEPIALPLLAGLLHRPSILWIVSQQVLYYNPAVRLPEFVLGAALGLLYVRRRENPARSALARVSSIHLRDVAYDVSLVALALLLVGVMLLPLPGQYPDNALAAPVFALVIVLLARERGTIARVLSWRGSVWLGEISYGVYILHAPLWALLAMICAAAFHLSPAAPLLFPIYLISVIVASGLSYRFVERPMRGAIRANWARWEARRKLSAHRAASVETAATRAVR